MESKLEEREREVFKILEKLAKIKKVILIGGYAMNAYSDFPRFSLDCDLVVDNPQSCRQILIKSGFKRKEKTEDFERYEKPINGTRVGADILIGKIIDRQSGTVFDINDLDPKFAEIFGKSDSKLSVKFYVISPEMLFITKFAVLRRQDLRDIFMLTSYKLEKKKIQAFLRKYFTQDLKKEKITRVKIFLGSRQFLHSLQGVYGKLPEKFIERNKRMLLSLLE